MATADTQAIEQVIQAYLDGFHEGDADKLAEVFHPTCALTQSLEGELQILSREQWLDLVRHRPSPLRLGLAREDRLLSLALEGPTLARVTLNCAIPPRYFTDLLSLLKVNGRWQIAQKVFMTDLRT